MSACLSQDDAATAAPATAQAQPAQRTIVDFGTAPVGYVAGAGRGLAGQYGNKIDDADRCSRRGPANTMPTTTNTAATAATAATATSIPPNSFPASAYSWYSPSSSYSSSSSSSSCF